MKSCTRLTVSNLSCEAMLLASALCVSGAAHLCPTIMSRNFGVYMLEPNFERCRIILISLCTFCASYALQNTSLISLIATILPVLAHLALCTRPKEP